MKVVVEGLKDGKTTAIHLEFFDRKDEVTGLHSMARTTGYTATVALRMIADGVFTQKGVIVPEYLRSHPECVDYLLKGLRKGSGVHGKGGGDLEIAIYTVKAAFGCKERIST